MSLSLSLSVCVCVCVLSIQGFQAGTIRFMFDGNQIGPEQTPIEVSQQLLTHTHLP